MDDQEMVVAAAVGGVGLGYTMLDYAQPHLVARRLVQVLLERSELEEGFYLYYPSRKNLPAALRAVIEHWRYVSRKS